MKTFKGHCACHSMPNLVRVTRITDITGDWDTLEFIDKARGTTSTSHHGWYDKEDGLWPIQPLCRKRWLPKIMDAWPARKERDG